MASIVKRIVKGSGGLISAGDATAEQWDIKTGKTAYLPAGKVTGAGYFPAAMDFDGSTGHYSKTSGVTFSGNKITFVVGFKIASFSGATRNYRVLNAAATGGHRGLLRIYSSDYSTTTARNKLSFYGQTSGGTVLFHVFSTADVNDGAWHTAHMDYDGDAGTATLYIDGADDLDTGNAEHVLTTGTLTTSPAAFHVGADSDTANFTDGLIGFVGCGDTAGLTSSDLMQTDGTPKPLDEATWTEWGAQPLFWHEAGKMDENLGSAGAMTKNGTITLASAIP